MKERVKAFYKKHEDTITNVAIGAGLGLAAGLILVIKTEIGNEVEKGTLLQRDDGRKVFVVIKKNGRVKNLYEPINKD